MSNSEIFNKLRGLLREVYPMNFHIAENCHPTENMLREGVKWQSSKINNTKESWEKINNLLDTLESKNPNETR